MTFTSALLLLAPVLLLIIAARNDVRRRARVTEVSWIYLVPAAVLLVYSIFWRVPATRILSELHGIAFRSQDGQPLRKEIRERSPGSSRVLVGDVAARRRRMPQAVFGTLVFRPRMARSEDRGTLMIELPAPEKRAGVIGTSQGGFLGALDVEDGDLICVAADCWTYSRADDAFTSGKQTFAIPPRQARIPGLDWTFALPFARPIPMTTRTYSLGWLARHGSVPSERIRSFVGYTRRSRNLQFVPLDANVTLRRDGTVVTANRTYPVEAGERIAFYTLPAEGVAFESAGVVERRSLVYEPGQRSFALDFDTPEIHSLTPAELDALRLERPAKKVVALAMGDAQLVDRSLYFSGVSESVALQANALIELSRFFPRDFRDSYRIVSPRGPTDASIGAPAWIGATDLAAVRLLVMRPPLLLLIVALALQLLKVLSAATSRFTIAQALFAGALEVLVGIRLLLGHRVWSMPPHKIEGAELGLVAWMMLPWIFLVASLPAVSLRDVRKGGFRSLPLAWACTLGGVLLSMAFCAVTVEGNRKYVWILCHLIAIGVALLRAAEPRQWLSSRRVSKVGGRLARSWRASRPAAGDEAPGRIPGAGGRDARPPSVASATHLVRLVIAALFAVVMWLLVRRAAGAIGTIVLVFAAFAAGYFLRRITAFLRELIDRELAVFVWWSIAFCAARIVLLLFGFKESAMVPGGRISLSAVYVPAAAILQGLFLWRVWTRVGRNGRLRAPELASAAMLLFFVWAAPAVLTSDIGLFLVNVPVFLLLLFAVDRRSRVVLAMVVLFAIVIAGGPLLRLALPLVSSEETLLSLASDSNYARFFHFAAPEQLQALATKRGESLAITSAILQQYISSGFFGRGYGRSEVTIHLGDTALRDFAPAVFVAAEWGLAGTMAMILTYAVFGFVAYRLTPLSRRNAGGLATQRIGSAALITCVAAGTITIASIYMILANHELLLLTGKNAYLLGLDSAGDLLETFALLLVIGFGAASLRDAADVQPGGFR